MQYETKSPESLDELKEIKLSEEAIEFVERISKESAEEKTKRNSWDSRQDNLTKKRYGIRSKKTFPWPGAANFTLPQIDTDINRIKPAYINMAFGVSPIVTYTGFGADDIEPARKRELLFDWRMKTQMDFFKPYCLGIDYLLSRGFVLFKTGWKFETNYYCKKLDLADLDDNVLSALYMPEVDDNTLGQIIAEEMLPDLTLQENIDEIQRVIAEFRKGKTEFEFNFVEKAINTADVKALDPRSDVIFPVDCCDIQEAEFIEHRYTMSKSKIRMMMNTGKFKPFTDDEISGWAGSSDYTNTTADYLKSVRDGINANYEIDDDNITICEVDTWYDVNNDGVDERVRICYPLNNPRQCLYFIENPYDHGQFPYVIARREINDAEIISSRGIPQIDEDFQTGITTLFNQDIDAGTISTTPTIVARKNSVKNLRNLRYVPGQVVETENGTADYQVTQNPNLGQSARFANMQYLKAWANDRVGNMQAAISSSNNTPGQAQIGTKTAKEVMAISAMASQNTAMDLLVFQYQMKDLYFQLDSLFYQFGDDVEEFAITGSKPIKVTRQEIRGKFNIVPNGKVNDADPVARSSQAQSLLQMLTGNPFIRQDVLIKLFLDSYDTRVSNALIKTPEEMKQAAQQQVMAENDKLGVALNMQKARNMLEVEKAAMLTPIEGRKYASE
ncbi:MAG: hypothetical protein KBC84_06930 [Proteobacteria bacterium]|nr:hypothetical protein [Pseudomonadota bacterium]